MFQNDNKERNDDGGNDDDERFCRGTGPHPDTNDGYRHRQVGRCGVVIVVA